MALRERVTRWVISQFRNPRGLGGHVTGWIMGHRPSNVQRNRWVVSLLDLSPTDRILEVGFWPDPEKRLEELRKVLRPGGLIAIASQPRCPGATAATSDAAAGEIVALLEAVGFDDLRVERLDLQPPVICVL